MPDDFDRRSVLKGLGLAAIGAAGTGTGLEYATQTARAVAPGLGSTVNYTDDVIYQILTDRFVDGDPSNNPDGDQYDPNDLTKYHGGDWQGIVDRIQDGYLPEMGVTALWISPPVENVYEIHPNHGTASYHGFWARDMKKPNPFFGDMSDFEKLVDVAHDHGIKIVIDFAPNHTSPHTGTSDGEGMDGTLYDDGTFVADYEDDPNGYFRHNGGIENPSYEDAIYRNLFDLSDLDVQESYIDQYLKDAITMWLDKGVDGIRVDAVKHMPPGWQKTFMDTIYDHEPVFTFGEWFLGTGQSVPEYYEFSNETGMSLLDFRFGQKLREVLRDRTDDFTGLHDVVEENTRSYEEFADRSLELVDDTHEEALDSLVRFEETTTEVAPTE